MPDTTFFGDYPFPTDPEAAGAPADFMALAEALDSHTVLFASSQADRDANFGGLPAGGLVSCAAERSVWQSLGGSPTKWTRVAYDSGVKTTGFAYQPGWSAGAWREIRNKNGVISVHLEVERTGAPIVADANGNLVDQSVAFLPWLPPRTTPCAMTFGGRGVGGAISVLGSVFIFDTRPNYTLFTGGTLIVNATWLEAYDGV